MKLAPLTLLHVFSCHGLGAIRKAKELFRPTKSAWLSGCTRRNRPIAQVGSSMVRLRDDPSLSLQSEGQANQTKKPGRHKPR